MDCNEEDNSGAPPVPPDESRSAVNSLVLDYYKKFGRKRDLEQYFSLSTAHSDIRDPSSPFWSRIKAENESSDSGEKSEKKSESPQELCRISIRFPAHDPSTSQEEDSKTKTDSVSPPIIIEELPHDSTQNSEDEGVKSDDNNSQKSYDVLLDTSVNKPHSPSSSITSQRKLEWDSLADVGYANESDRKTSASSLSTLERLALKQQYSNNDTQLDSNVGLPTAHSTPLEECEPKLKTKKGAGKKTTKIYKKDVDFLEMNIPHSSNMNPAQSINVNLTKHISFNVEKDGKVTVENVQKDVTVSPEKVSVETEVSPRMKIDKEMQTSLTQLPSAENVSQSQPQRIPILISLNTLRTRIRRKKLQRAKRKIKSKKRADKENIPVQEKSGEQLSEAESFEYMPGHIYNQNQMTSNDQPSNVADNKSSLESSGVLTTDSSKGSKHSFAKDLEKSVDMLKAALQQHCDDSNIRKQLVKEVCQRLLKSRYRDDDSTSDFLSGLSYGSKKLGLGTVNNMTSSTSDTNKSVEISKRPKKSILRTDKFNPGSIASTSQSVPNIPVASTSENLITSNLVKKSLSSNTDSDMSSKEKTSSDNVLVKATSEELYKKYLQALKREEAYKRHLKDKEMFLKQKLVSSDNVFKVPARVEMKPINRLADLMHDLTRNNYDDGSGDASKLEGGPGSNTDFHRFLSNRTQRSHSVFTISSGNSGDHSKKPNMKKRLQSDLKDLCKPGTSKEGHYCCCPHHSGNLKLVDSSVQVNINDPCSVDSCPAKKNNDDPPEHSAKVYTEGDTSNITYVCHCNRKPSQDAPHECIVYKCSQLNKGIQLQEASNDVHIKCTNDTCEKINVQNVPSTSIGLTSKSSQTNMLCKMLHEQSVSNGSEKIKIKDMVPKRSNCSICEATRWIQTEISINPKITEPTLSDINIVSDTNCAKLICEQHREILKPSLTSVFSCQADGTNASTNSGSYKSSGTSKDAVRELKDYCFHGDTGKNKTGYIEDDRTKIGQTEKFTIPIHGTNMTLMVSIGSDCRACTNKIVREMKTQCIGTDKVKAIEQATCLAEECSKGVQINKTGTDSTTTDHNSNNIGDVHQNNLTKSFSPRRESKFGTYPKTSLISEQKPFRRTKTDTDADHTDISKYSEDKFDMQDKKCSCGCKGDKGTCSKLCMEYNLSQRGSKKHLCRQNNIMDDKKCLCSCGGFKVDCKESCMEHNISSYKKPTDSLVQCTFGSSGLRFADPDEEFDLKTSIKEFVHRQRSSRQPSIHEDMSCDSQSEKCPCGCGGTKDKCKSSCKELKSPKKQCGVQTTEQTPSQQSTSSTGSEKCTCGCGGAKDKCNKNCKESKPSPKGQCGAPKSIDKQIETQTDMSCGDNEKCPCGCGGVKNKCKNTCKEFKPKDQGQCKKVLTDKQIDTQTDMPTSQTEKCPCGCGGTKDKCKKSCRELKSKSNAQKQCGQQIMNKQIDTQTDMPCDPKEKCPCGCGGTKDKCKSTCKELKSSPKEKCGMTSMHQQIDTQTNMPIEKHDPCPCGCGGTKDKCKSSCKELKSPSKKQCGTQHSGKQENAQTDISFDPNDNCPCGCGGTKGNCLEDCIELGSSSRVPIRKQSVDKAVDTPPNFSNLQYEKCPCGCGGTKNNCKRTCKEIQSPPSCARVGQFSDEPTRISRSIDLKCKANNERFKGPQKRNKSGSKSRDSSSDDPKKSTDEADEIPERVLNMIQNITKKYAKKDIYKSNRKKCYKEIITVLNYLLDTDDSTDQKDGSSNKCKTTPTDSCNKTPEKTCSREMPKKYVDKGIQLSCKASHPRVIDTSDLLTSTDIAGTSSSSPTCKVLNKIQKECERFHQKRCKIHSGKKCDGTSSTSVNCDQCRRVHHCLCKSHKCKSYKRSNEKLKKTPVAYNLILQTSESMLSDGTCQKQNACDKNRPLQNIIVKVPKKKPSGCVPFREMAAKFEAQMFGPDTIKGPRTCRSRSMPNEGEMSCMEEIMRKTQGATVREYLEKNRPDFVEKCSQRQNCLKYISESRCEEPCARPNLKMVVIHTQNCSTSCNPFCGGASKGPNMNSRVVVVPMQTGVARIDGLPANERAVKRELLSMHMAQLPDVTELGSDELRQLARDLGRHMRQKHTPKLISEREMKKHSQAIYKNLPEVVQKKEEKRKESMKKTNLLMANIFKRNLQKKTLHGSVNLSNYSNVVKI